MKICRQQETENYGAVSFIIKTGREYAAKRTNEVLRQKEKQIPFNNRLNWCVSPMPATEYGKTKLAWQMAEEISKQLSLSFIKPILSCDKPQMKQLSIKEKIEIWEKIYYDKCVILDNQIR